VLNPNPYTGAFGNDGARYAEDVADVIATATPGERPPILRSLSPQALALNR
jgi:hypothetical protein